MSKITAWINLNIKAMCFHELMKETWKEGLGEKKKKSPKTPYAGDWTFDCLADDAGYSASFKVLLGNKSMSKMEKRWSTAMMSYLKTLVSKYQSLQLKSPVKRIPCSPTKMLSSPYTSNYYLSRNNTYLMTNTKGVSESLSTLNFAFSNISR